MQDRILRLLIIFISSSFFITHADAQNTPSHQAIVNMLQTAEKNYPLLKAKGLEVEAAKKGIDISRNTLIPSLDAAYQADYATYNNITGMVFPQYIVPMTGPVPASNNYNGVFGSAASLILNWQPLTFGQRQAQVDYAKTALEYARADASNEIFRHKIKVVNAYLDVLMAAEMEKVYAENLQRTVVNLSVVRTLVTNGIKPGADTALLNAEVSQAKVELLKSGRSRAQALILLSRLLGGETPSISDSSYFQNLPANTAITDSAENPLLPLYRSSISLVQARKKVLTKTTMPSLTGWSTLYARGSGVNYDGTVKATDGLAFQKYNYGLGLQISVPILQYARIRPQLQQQDFLIGSNTERLNEINLQLKKEIELADTSFYSALAIARESPVFYESALFSYKALLSRYQSGLANFADLIQAQYELVKAETDRQSAYIDAWKALLYKAAVTGDLNLFLNQIR